MPLVSYPNRIVILLYFYNSSTKYALFQYFVVLDPFVIDYKLVTSTEECLSSRPMAFARSKYSNTNSSRSTHRCLGEKLQYQF